jgi:hypothetical protein
VPPAMDGEAGFQTRAPRGSDSSGRLKRLGFPPHAGLHPAFLQRVNQDAGTPRQEQAQQEQDWHRLAPERERPQ